MTAWALAHPWMAFWLAVITVFLIDNSIANIAKAISERK